MTTSSTYAPPAKHVPEWTLGDRMRKARMDARLTAQRISDLIGISRKSVTNYENGDTHPLPVILQAWADVTGVYVEWLKGGEAPVNPTQAGDKPRESMASAPIAQLAEQRTFNPKSASSRADADALALMKRLGVRYLHAPKISVWRAR